MIHKMKLHDVPFSHMKSGQKTIELRLRDEKRQLLQVGDIICFTNTKTGEELHAEILQLHVFSSFEALYRTLPLLKCGYTEQDIVNASPCDMEAYYSLEEQQKHGVLGIELKVI